jgi:hypothetical protein
MVSGGDGRHFSDDIYAPYDGPNGSSGRHEGGGMESQSRHVPVSGAPSQQIMVRNVSAHAAIYFMFPVERHRCLLRRFRSCLGRPQTKI